ncbi:hypothetical protein [Rickettsia sp. TH2014]|uniref:hypothetical protein n=1 Tax=Rickettsia sp. TH2014 TaxID=1967503 RepID=UPI001C46EEFB|nr:hypothetical protein [Rickettsia sp. TH2014]
MKKLFVIYKDENGVEFEHLEMTKLFVRFGVQIPDNIDILCDDSLIRHHPTKGSIKNLLLSIKELENLQGDDCINAYNASTPEVQEIWDARVSRYHLNKLAKFIEKKFSKESTIENTEYAALREYSSLSKHKQEVLEILLARKNFNSDDFVKVDNHIKDHFFEIACTVKDLTGTVFAAIAKAGIISEVTQYLHFEDSSIKIAGMSLDNNTAGDYS